MKKDRLVGKNMKITIACVGKIKEKFYRDAILEYEKRLSRYCKLELIEVADEKTPENASALVESQIHGKKKGNVSGQGSKKSVRKERMLLPLRSTANSLIP